jgi:hypothetical protein
VPRHHRRATGHHFDVRRSRFAHQLERREATADDLKARRDRWRMIAHRLALTASHTKTTSHRLNPIDAHIHAARHGFTPRAAYAIPTRDHFTHRNWRRQVIANDMNVIEHERLPTSMQPVVMPRDAFCSVHRPPITQLHAAIGAYRFAAPVAREHVRPGPAHPRRVTPVARLHRDEAAVLRWQRSRRGSRPREWHVRRESHPPALAPALAVSRPLHARTAMKRPCFAGNGRATAPARARGTCIPRAALSPSPRPRRGSRPRE